MDSRALQVGHEVARATLGRRHGGGGYDRVRKDLNARLQQMETEQRDCLIASALDRLRAENPDLAKAVIHAAVGTSLEWTAWALDRPKTTVRRLLREGEKKLLEIIEKDLREVER